MRVGGFDLSHHDYAEPAGSFQRAGDLWSLIVELGSNYGKYHAALVASFEQRGGRPDPDAYQSFDTYAQAWAEIQGIVTCEAFLRSCRGYQLEGRSLDAAMDLRVPLIDASNQMVSLETGAAG